MSNDWHITLLWSNKGCVSPGALTRWLNSNFINPNAEFEVTLSAFDCWTGHNNNKTYVGIDWESPKIQLLNQILDDKFDLPTDFDGYKCHTTLGKHENLTAYQLGQINDNIGRLNQFVKQSSPFKFKFSWLQITNADNSDT